MNADEVAEFGKKIAKAAENLRPLMREIPDVDAPPMLEMEEVAPGIWLSREVAEFLRSRA